MQYYLVHGFNLSDGGADTVGRVLPHAQGAGINAQLFSYPWTFLFSLSWRTEEAVEKLIELADGKEIGVLAHSHGNVIAVKAAQRGCKIVHLIAIQPALKRDTSFPPIMRRVDVVYNPGDNIVTWAKRWRELANAMPWRDDNPHMWGSMGRNGPETDNPAVIRHEIHKDFKHSGMFAHKFMLLDFVGYMVAFRKYWWALKKAHGQNKTAKKPV